MSYLIINTHTYSTDLFLYTLKVPENQVSCFQGVSKETIGMKRVNVHQWQD